MWGEEGEERRGVQHHGFRRPEVFVLGRSASRDDREHPRERRRHHLLGVQAEHGVAAPPMAAQAKVGGEGVEFQARLISKQIGTFLSWKEFIAEN